MVLHIGLNIIKSGKLPPPNVHRLQFEWKSHLDSNYIVPFLYEYSSIYLPDSWKPNIRFQTAHSAYSNPKRKCCTGLDLFGNIDRRLPRQYFPEQSMSANDAAQQQRMQTTDNDAEQAVSGQTDEAQCFIFEDVNTAEDAHLDIRVRVRL
ncbi:hypothetical protein V502_01460 [Pseudogymnoascus sp. VKM F-4520 (FW-2644)]|nr:hypothetical protein V502_01460 [Pseudogymnoascus sp. VKM F-4520 (FW-2644)]